RVAVHVAQGRVGEHEPLPELRQPIPLVEPLCVGPVHTCSFPCKASKCRCRWSYTRHSDRHFESVTPCWHPSWHVTDSRYQCHRRGTARNVVDGPSVRGRRHPSATA